MEGEKKCVSQFAKNAEQLQKPQEEHWGKTTTAGEEKSGRKYDLSPVFTRKKRQTCTNSLLNNLYNNIGGSRGEGVGLGLLCAREEEPFPGDVILTGRGQLSQYDSFQKK